MPPRSKSRRGAAMQDGQGSDINAASAPDQPFTLQDIPLSWLQVLVKVLPGHSKLNLMQCSKMLAQLVVQFSPTPPMLRLEKQESHQLSVFLAQAAPTLHLVLQGRAAGSLSVITSLPRGRITHLTLKDMKITTEVLRGLQLQWWSQLSTLKLEYCSSDMSAADVNSLAQTRRDWLPPTCSELDVHTIMPKMQQMLADMAKVVRPSIYRLSAPKGIGYIHESLLRHVTHIQMYQVWSFEKLLKLPCLQHVTCNTMEAKDSDRQLPCQLQCLEINNGAAVAMLARVPSRIKQVIVRKWLQSTDDDDVVSQFVAGPPVVCAPSHQRGAPNSFTLLGLYHPGVLSKVASSLSGCLCFKGFYGMGITLPPTCLPSLAQLPAAVTRLCFTAEHDEDLPSHQLPARVQYWSELAQALPPHIRQLHLVEKRSGGQDAVALACVLRVLKHGPILLLDKGGEQLANACAQHVRVIQC